MTLENFILQHEASIRLSCFAAVFVAMLLWELLAPRRRLSQPRTQRWSGNIALMILNSLLLRLAFPAAAVGVAYFVSQQGWGLFNLLDWPIWLEVLLAVLLLDLAIYFQHRLMHAIPVLWRLHRVHHADLDFDLTTAVRFHSIEILLSMVIKSLLILLLGPALLAVLIFEILLNGVSIFNHSNVSLPAGAESLVRKLVVTPDMHRVHHSNLPQETNSNFGFNLSVWDRLLKTYVAQPRDGHDGMTIGLDDFRDSRQVSRLVGMLKIPFTGKS